MIHPPMRPSDDLSDEFLDAHQPPPCRPLRCNVALLRFSPPGAPWLFTSRGIPHLHGSGNNNPGQESVGQSRVAFALETRFRAPPLWRP